MADLENTIHSICKYSEKDRYRLLGRMQADCEYFLGFGFGSESCLWAHSISGQIACMKALWRSFDKGKKPIWIKMKDIDNYSKRMREYKKQRNIK